MKELIVALLILVFSVLVIDLIMRGLRCVLVVVLLRVFVPRHFML
jgi:hypothetical protein